ncbi:sigma-70 family RNA polymerase sigma factor [candidate division KSB1 bacterium]|nr:sigma-70 family RNA polymerase sigma factor [candidate division KSB1 bacterium]
MDNAQIQELARKAKGGDAQALEGLLTDASVRAMIVAVARKMLPDTDPEDMYQEVRMKLYQALPNWQEQGSILHYIRRIAHNTCVNELRKTPHRFVYTLPEYDPAAEAARIEKQGKMALLEAALQEMDAPCREMLTHFLIEHVPKNEIKARVPWKKTAFHQKWARCCEILTRKIRRMMQKLRTD